jgi:hypothetical protein
MHSLIMYNRTAWNDYFSGITPNTYSSEYGATQTPSASSGGGVYVLNCLFNGCTSGSNGGALYCSTSVTYLLIESSSFFSCKTSSNGGAIYFSNSNDGQSVLDKVCGNDCYSTYTGGSYGQFAQIIVNNSLLSNNYVNYSSIIRCVPNNSDAHYTIYLVNGKICCQSVNSSLNRCYCHSGISLCPLKDSSYTTCSLSYSSFADNKASDYICIWFGTTGAKYEMKCCNILRNTQVSSSWGIIHTNGNMIIEDSCILENEATSIFYVDPPHTLTLSNCTVDKTTKAGGSFTIVSTVTKSFIHGLNHLSTQNCHSGYDSLGTLTAIPYVPHSTKKELCYCFTIKVYHYHSIISDFFSSVWLLTQ